MRAANVGDVTVADDVVRESIEKFGGLDILVNNAATNPYFGATMEVDEGRSVRYLSRQRFWRGLRLVQQFFLVSAVLVVVMVSL